MFKILNISKSFKFKNFLKYLLAICINWKVDIKKKEAPKKEENKPQQTA